MLNIKYVLGLIIVSGSVFYSCEGEGNREVSKNPPEIVDRSSDDTVFNKVPGEAHHGIETYAEVDGSESLARSLAAVGSFSTFTEALNQADIAETLESEGELTIFAPTDLAFSKIPQEKLNELFIPENKQKLVKFVYTYIVRGNINHDDLTDGKTLINLNKNTIKVKVVDGHPTVHNSIVREQDVNPENGALFALDEVVIPPGM